MANSAGPATGAYITERVPTTTFTWPNATARYVRYRSAAGMVSALSTATSPTQPPAGAGANGLSP